MYDSTDAHFNLGNYLRFRSGGSGYAWHHGEDGGKPHWEMTVSILCAALTPVQEDRMEQEKPECNAGYRKAQPIQWEVPQNDCQTEELYPYTGVSLLAQTVKKLPAMQETQVWSLGQEDALEKGMATHSSIPAWRIPWTEEGYSPWDCKRVGHDWATNTFTFINTLSTSGQAVTTRPDLVTGWGCPRRPEAQWPHERAAGQGSQLVGTAGGWKASLFSRTDMGYTSMAAREEEWLLSCYKCLFSLFPFSLFLKWGHFVKMFWAVNSWFVYFLSILCFNKRIYLKKKTL